MATKAKTKAQKTAERKTRNAQPKHGRGGGDAGKTNALELLEQDHREVEELFDQFDELEDDAQKEELAQKICLELTVHAQIEEEIFYPEARKATGDDDLLDEALVEHASAKHLIAEIEQMSVEEELFEAKVKVLGEMVKHHIVEEEEELFPELGRSKMDLDAVGQRLAKRKAELLEEMQNA